MTFKLRSGNTTPFKQMGSSPVKQGKTKPVEQGKEKSVEGKLEKHAISRPRVNLPKEIKSDLAKQTPREDTLEGRTKFEYDILDPIKTNIMGIEEKMGNPSANIKKGLKKTVKKVKDYFTKR